MIGRKKQKKKAYTNNQNDNTENRAIKEVVRSKTGITLVALVITILFSYDEKIKCSNSKGFLLTTI